MGWLALASHSMSWHMKRMMFFGWWGWRDETVLWVIHSLTLLHRTSNNIYYTCTFYTWFWLGFMWFELFFSFVQCAMCNVQCALYTVYCTLHCYSSSHQHQQHETIQKTSQWFSSILSVERTNERTNKRTSVVSLVSDIDSPLTK